MMKQKRKDQDDEDGKEGGGQNPRMAEVGPKVGAKVVEEVGGVLPKV